MENEKFKRLTNLKLLKKIEDADKLYSAQSYDDAIEAYKELVDEIHSSYKYDKGEVLRKLADVYYLKDDKENALYFYEKVLSYTTINASVYSILGYLYFEKNNKKSLNYYMKSLELAPNISNALLVNSSLLYIDGYLQKDLKRIFEKNIDMCRALILGEHSVFTHACPNANKRIHIGYMSSDLYCHAMMSFVLPLIEANDIEKYEFSLYSTGSNSDHVTQRIKEIGMKFVECTNLTNYEIASKIYEDKVDILVDLCGYTSNSLTTLIYKPAPIQMQYLGFLNTYGIKEVDYIFTDKFTIPENMAKYYEEKPFYIDCGMQRYDFSTKDTKLPDIPELPCLSNGYITFGSFNSVFKITKHTVLLWASLLRKVKNSKLLIFRSNMKDFEQAKLKSLFEEKGIFEDRLIFNAVFPADSHFSAYTLADIALDPTPFSGLTITIEQLAMGVPTVGLVGDTFQSRGAARINKMFGFDDLVSYNENEYVQKLVDLAFNLDRLKWYRANLRQIFLESDLKNDFQTFAQCVENGYEKVWSEYCTNFALDS